MILLFWNVNISHSPCCKRMQKFFFKLNLISPPLRFSRHLVGCPIPAILVLRSHQPKGTKAFPMMNRLPYILHLHISAICCNYLGWQGKTQVSSGLTLQLICVVRIGRTLTRVTREWLTARYTDGAPTDGADCDKLISKGWQITSARNAQTKRIQGLLERPLDPWLS